MRLLRCWPALLLLSACSRDLDTPTPAASSIDGRVVAEEPGTGRTIPAAGARVEVAGTGAAVLADAQGLFSFAHPPPPPRTLLVSWARSGSGAPDRQRTFKSDALDRTGAVQLGDVLVAANAQLSGRVVLADKPRDAPEQAGTVLFVPHFPYSAVTGAGGTFLLSHLPPGPITLGISRPGYALGSVEAIDLAPGASLGLQEIALQPAPGTAAQTGSIKGLALRADGSPAAGVQVAVAPSQGGAAKTATTATDGAFSVAGLPLGVYAVTLTDAASSTSALVGGVVIAPGASAGSAVDLGSITLSAAPLPQTTTGTPPALPEARPGADQSAAPGATVLLDASASDGTGLSFHWAADSATVTFSANDSAQAARTSFVVPQALAPITVALTVTDSLSQQSQPQTLKVTVLAPALPVAKAGADQVVAPNAAVLLDASASVGAASWHWSASGAAVVFSVNDSPLAVHTSFAAPVAAAEITLTLTVTDALGQTSAPATAHVFVDPLPVPALTAPALTRTATPTLLDASGTTDANAAAALTYTFAAVAQPAGASVTFTPGPLPSQRYFAASAEGTYQFQVAVDDGHVAATSSAVTVQVSNVNRKPSAVVRAPATVEAGADITLDGSLSSDPDPGETATLTYAWSALSGAPATSSTGTPVVHATAPSAAATLNYQLIVTDTHGASSPAAAVLVAVNAPPPPPPPPAATVVLTNPASGAANVATTSPIEVDYSIALDAASVKATPGAVTVTAGGAPLPGTLSYSEAGSGATARHALVFTPTVPLPSASPAVQVSVSVAPLKDLYARATGTASFTFSTGVPTWVDISPPDPRRTGTYTGAPDGGVDYSTIPTGPALATGSNGAYLLDVEVGTVSQAQVPNLLLGGSYGYGGTLRHWDLGNPDAGTFDGGSNWNIVGGASQLLESANGCCSSYGVHGATAADAPFWRTYLGVDQAGQAMLAHDFGDNLLQYATALGTATNRVQVPRLGATMATDGLNGWAAFRGCDSVSSAYVSDVYVARIASTSLVIATDALLSTPALAGVSSCSPMQQPSFDLWFGAPALASGAGKLYLLVTTKASQNGTSSTGLYARAAGDTTVPIPGPITDANHAAGALNQALVSHAQLTAAAGTPLGPVLVFSEGTPTSTPGAGYRVTRYDEASKTFVDPLTGSAADAAGGTTGSSAITPVTVPQLDGAAWSLPGQPAVAVVGANPYVAWQALNGAGHRVFVAHADPVLHKWLLDPDRRNADGALNVHAGCDASPPSIALVDGLPAVAWGESCSIGGQTQSQNFVVVRRLQ